MLILKNEFSKTSTHVIHGFKHDHAFLLIRNEDTFYFLDSLNELIKHDTDHDNIIDHLGHNGNHPRHIGNHHI